MSTPQFRTGGRGKPSPAFRENLRSIGNGEILLPQIKAILSDPSFEDFEVKVEGFRTRPPDGWFWPSTHPIWPEPALFQYLVDPSKLITEKFDPSGTMAVTTGSFIHSFLQIAAVREGVLVRQPEVCGCGRKHPERAEPFYIDHEAGTRGHADGVVPAGDLAEFKTMTPMKLDRMPRGGPDDTEVQEWFLKKCPDYYAQAQEYLRMSQRERSIVIITSLTYPYNMREIHVVRDRVFAHRQRDKYLRVRAAARAQRRPFCECGGRAATLNCPVRCA